MRQAGATPPDRAVPDVLPPQTGRRRRVSGGRSRQVRVRMSIEERKLVEERASRLGVTMARLLVESALSSGGLGITERRTLTLELMALRRLISSLSVNLDELRRVAATAGADATVWEPTSTAVAHAANRLSRALEPFAASARPAEASRP
ncbi:plasmid mobilization protein [Nonomuraea sp. NPDC003707]